MALSAPISTPIADPPFPGSPLSVPMAASSTIYKGSVVCLDSSGYAVKGASTSTLRPLGIAQETKTSGGSSGDTLIMVELGVVRLVNLSTDLIAESAVGSVCYLASEYEVGATNTTGPVAGTVAKYDGAYVWVTLNGLSTGLLFGAASGLPSQTGNSGKFLTTDGSNPSWGAGSGLPSQTGNSGKFITTNGTTASWSAIAESSVTNLTTDLAAKALGATTITAGTGLSGGGDLSANRTITLANTAVTPAAYTYASITVDQQGRLTAASSGAAPALAATTLTAGTGITGGGDLSANRSFTVDQSFSPTWSGNHIFSNPVIIGAAGAATGVKLEQAAGSFASLRSLVLYKGDESALASIEGDWSVFHTAVATYGGTLKNWLGVSTGLNLCFNHYVGWTNTGDAASGLDTALTRGAAGRVDVTSDAASTFANIKAAQFLISSPQSYTVTHHSDSRSLDETGVITVAALDNVVGTLIKDLIAAGLITGTVS